MDISLLYFRVKKIFFLLRRPYHGKWSNRPKNSTVGKLSKSSIYPHLLQPRARRCVAAGGVGIGRAFAASTVEEILNDLCHHIATDITTPISPPTSSSTHFSPLFGLLFPLFQPLFVARPTTVNNNNHPLKIEKRQNR